jgi:glycerate kinase
LRVVSALSDSRKSPNVIVALDAFKGTLDSLEAGEALARGIREERPRACVKVLAVADGGEGTLQSFLSALPGTPRRETVSDPLGRPVQALWGDFGSFAVVEMARASGLPLLRPDERRPLRTSTRGTGELMAAALRSGADEILVGAGGSATVDGGAGALAALGFAFLDRDGKDLPPGGGSLRHLHSVRDPGDLSKLRRPTWKVACDVRSPLLGRGGAAAVFGPQKGAEPREVDILEDGMRRIARIAVETRGVALGNLPLAGAAGGLAGGLRAFLGAELLEGAALVLDLLGFEKQAKGAELVVTGEGRIDGQSLEGKVLSHVATRAAREGLRCVAVAGSLGPGAQRLAAFGVERTYGVAPPGEGTSAELREKTPGWLAEAGRTIAREFL